MNWLQRLVPVKRDALARPTVSHKGLVALPGGGVGAFVHVWPRGYHDRDAFLASLAQLRAKLETLPAGGEPVWALSSRPEMWIAVWSAKGDSRRVLEGAARVAEHLAALGTPERPPEVVTDPTLAENVRQWWRRGQAVSWVTEYGGEAWQFTWASGHASLRQVATTPQTSLPSSTVHALSRPARSALPRLRPHHDSPGEQKAPR